MKKFCDESLVVSANNHDQIEIKMEHHDQYGYKYLTLDEAVALADHLNDLVYEIKNKIK